MSWSTGDVILTADGKVAHARHTTTFACEIRVAQSNEPKDHPCAFCKVVPGWAWWSNGGMDFARGYRTAICEPCCVAKELAHAREQAARIPALETRMKELNGGTP